MEKNTNSDIPQASSFTLGVTGQPGVLICDHGTSDDIPVWPWEKE